MKSKFAAILIAFLLLDFGLGFAQQFNLLSVDTSAFPVAKGWYFARTKSGSPYGSIVPADFVLQENGKDAPVINIECKKLSYFPPVSVNLLLDASTSMNDIAAGKEKKLDWAKYLGKTILDTLKDTPGTYISYSHFSSVIYRVSPWFTSWLSDNSSEYTWLEQNEIVYAGATNFYKPFTQTGGNGDGSIPRLKAMPYNIPRMIVLITDGSPEQALTQPQIDDIIKQAKDNKIIIYAISFLVECDPDIRFICQETGGRTWNVWVKDDIKIALRDLVGSELQNKNTCSVVWQSSLSCDDASRNRQVFAKFVRIPDSTTTSYMAPPPPTISSSANQFLFGIAANGGQTQQTLTLTAAGADYTINAINFSKSGLFNYDLSGAKLPLTIQKGKNQVIKLNYIEATPGQSSSTQLTFDVSPCPVPGVTLIAPCTGTVASSANCGQQGVGVSKDFTFNSIYKNNTVIPVNGSVSITGPDAADFSIVSGGGNFTLKTSESLNLKIRFNPSAIGTRNANIAIKLQTECGSASVPLTGEGSSKGVFDTDESNLISLDQNSPNPFSGMTEISYTVNGTMPVSLSIYNIFGEKVKDLLINQQSSGSNRIAFDASEFPSGVYIYKLESGNHTAARSMVISH